VPLTLHSYPGAALGLVFLLAKDNLVSGSFEVHSFLKTVEMETTGE